MTNRTGFSSGRASMRIGKIRLRQVRVKNGKCLPTEAYLDTMTIRHFPTWVGPHSRSVAFSLGSTRPLGQSIFMRTSPPIDNIYLILPPRVRTVTDLAELKSGCVHEAFQVSNRSQYLSSPVEKLIRKIGVVNQFQQKYDRSSLSVLSSALLKAYY